MNASWQVEVDIKTSVVKGQPKLNSWQESAVRKEKNYSIESGCSAVPRRVSLHRTPLPN